MRIYSASVSFMSVCILTLAYSRLQYKFLNKWTNNSLLVVFDQLHIRIAWEAFETTAAWAHPEWGRIQLWELEGSQAWYFSEASCQPLLEGRIENSYII